MKVHGSAELARMMLLQRQSADTRMKLDRAALEMTTGLKADKYKATGGNLARLFAVERMLERNAVRAETLNLTELRIDFMQDALGKALGLAETLSVDLLAAAGLGDDLAGRVHAEGARRAFFDTVNLLNVQVVGQALFAGDATDGAALAAPATILADIEAAVAGAVDAADAIARVEAFFAGPAFDQGSYLGSPDPLVPAELGEGVRLEYSLLATQPELKALLKGHAIAALVAPGGILAAEPVGTRMALIEEGGRQLLAAKDDLLRLRTRVGSAQESVEMAKARGTAEREALDLARARIVGADPYDAASAFQALEAQLETVFTVTARLSGLRFVNFMR
jgi:flagellar hook-associated protein 3 FlgL